jgi:choline transport protein
VPIYGILLTFIVQIALNSIYFGTVTGFNTVVSIATEGFCKTEHPILRIPLTDNILPDVSYAIPILLRVIAPLTMTTAPRFEGPWNLGRWSLPINIMALVYLLFTSITFNFPSLNPVDSENMNYTSAAVGVVMLVALITWFTTAKGNFRSPGISEDVVIHSAPHTEGDREAEIVRDEKALRNAY